MVFSAEASMPSSEESTCSVTNGQRMRWSQLEKQLWFAFCKMPKSMAYSMACSWPRFYYSKTSSKKLHTMNTYGLETCGASLNNREVYSLADKVMCWLVKINSICEVLIK